MGNPGLPLSPIYHHQTAEFLKEQVHEFDTAANGVFGAKNQSGQNGQGRI